MTNMTKTDLEKIEFLSSLLKQRKIGKSDFVFELQELLSIDSINVYFPSVNTISDTTICLNQTIIWDTELIGDYDFTWYGSSETTNSILINMQGQYAVMVTDTNECNYLTDTIFVSTDIFCRSTRA